MKKLNKVCLLMIMLFATTVNCFASSDKVDDFKSQIMNYIRTEGYVPSYDDDGDIKFKAEGSTYYVSVCSYDDGFYVTLTYYLGIEDSNIAKVREAMDKAMRGRKYVRMYTTKSQKTLLIETTWFCANLTDFTQFFSNGLDVVQLGKKDVKEYYKD